MDSRHAAVFLSIVIPVYNEEKRIEQFLSDAITFLCPKQFTYEIIIVDDGSTDATVAVTEDLLKERLDGRYRIIKLPRNMGKGGAVKRGMIEAAGEYALFIDADGSTSIHEIDRFMAEFSPAYAIYTAIRTKKHEAPLKRKFFGYGYIHLANTLLGMKRTDFTCGFKCYRRDAAQRIFPKQNICNWSFDAEDLFIAKKYDYLVKEIPVYWKHYGGSKVKVFKNIIICGFDLLRIRLNDLCGKYADAG